MIERFPVSRTGRLALATLLVGGLCLATAAVAEPFHTPTIDGAINADGTDWAVNDRVYQDPTDDWPVNFQNLRNLWVTWDETNLYLGLRYQANPAGLLVLMDLGKGTGAADASVLDTAPHQFALSAGRTIDMIMWRDGAGANDPTVLPEIRLVAADGTTTDISAETQMAQTFGYGGTKRIPFWMFGEYAIPWSAIYGDEATTVAPGAALQCVALITDDVTGTGAFDSAPDNPAAVGATGMATLDQLHVSVIDVDGDGEPDPCGASASGVLILEDDDGVAAVTVRAVLRRDGADAYANPLRTFTGAAGERSYTLPRLPAGTYRITAEATGFTRESVDIALAQDEQLADADITLHPATAVRGTISFTGGPGDAVTVAVSLDGEVVDSRRYSFTSAGGDYLLYVRDSGTYTVTVTAPTYMTASTDVDVTAGTDVEGVDFALVRQTEIAGVVRFARYAEDAIRTVLTLRDAAGEDVYETSIVHTRGDSTFSLFTPTGGDFTIATTTSGNPDIFLPSETSLSVTAGTDITDLVIAIPIKPEVLARLAFEGPPSATTVVILATGTTDTLETIELPADPAPSWQFFGLPGTYDVIVDAPGYDLWDSTLTVATDQVYDLGSRELTAVRATRILLVDDAGVEIESTAGTVSIPADDTYNFTPLRLAARDEVGREDLYDLDGRLTGYRFRPRKLDDVSPPRGTVRFTRSEAIGDTVTTLAFADGRALAYLSDDAVEVLHVYTENETAGAPTGRLMVGIREPEPAFIVLTANRDTFTADDADTVRITAQLYDSTERISLTAEMPLTFSVSSSSAGSGVFDVATKRTNGFGQASALLTATGAGELLIDCGGVFNDQALVVRADSLTSDLELLPVVARPGPTVRWRVEPASALASVRSTVAVTAQLVDALDNSTPVADEVFTFTAAPSGMGTFDPATALSDTSGLAMTTFVPAGPAGAVTLGGTSASYEVATADMQLRDVAVVSDPPWYAELRTRQTFDQTDLTTVLVDNDADGLDLEIPFSTTFDNMQMHVIFETNWDAAGGTRDSFDQPVNYGQADKPDYVMNIKYFWDGDYSDMRKWSGGTWANWYDTAAETYVDAYNDNVRLSGKDVFLDPEKVRIHVPWAAFGGAPDSLRLEVYLTQDARNQGSIQRSAFDSSPSDSTLDLTFDYRNPGPDDWDVAAGPVTLVAWSDPYVPVLVFPEPPTVSEAAAEPAAVEAGGLLTVSARVENAGDGVGDVLADLSGMAGSSLARMRDDGLAGSGDELAGDGIYSLLTTVPLASPGGEIPIVVSAYDGTNRIARRDTVAVAVEASVEILVHTDDPRGDDHGPDHPGTERMYYTYPTNSAFVPGGFDLTSMDVYRTTAVVSGKPVEMLAFEIGIVDFPNPDDPGTADWNPLYGELNIEKLDILIDSAPGGATKSLPARGADVERWDAWEYAVIADGWYKAIIPSLGQNTLESWRTNAKTADKDIILTGDPDLNRITAMVSLEALGNPTDEDIRTWDIIVMMSSHDGGDASVFGGVRWVNTARSEWNFGGGHDTDRDSNIIDLLLRPGQGKHPGLTQEEMLDYESAAAIARLDNGETPCAVSATEFEDTGPPVIRITRDAGEVMRRLPLVDAPVALSLKITDDWRVDRTLFRYRPTSWPGDGWAVEEPMGYIGNDLYIVDFLPAWLDTALVPSPLDSLRYLEFQVVADDPLDKETVSPVVTLQLDPAAECIATTSPMSGGDIDMQQVDGSSLLIGDELRGLLVDAFREGTGSSLEPDSLAGVLTLTFDACQLPGAVRNAPAVPAGTPLGIFRDVYLDAAVPDGEPFPFEGRLPQLFDVSLHYPQEWVPDGADEQKIGLYEYEARSNRWVLVGGHVNPVGNTVDARIRSAGTYGLFHARDLGYDPNAVVSGITISPNPFSPNGDGLYDTTNISFFLSQEATVTLEIYNIDGRRQRIITERFPYSGTDNDARIPRRVPGLIWDGTNHRGDPVPYGIYILRLIVTYNQAGGQRSIRSNHSVAVIR